jgi:hypothetical protein
VSSSRRVSRSLPRSLGAGLALLGAALVLSACQEVPSNLVKSEPYELQPIEGTDRSRIKLADETAARIDLQTAKVALSGKQKVVPHLSLIYNPYGEVFVYTRPKAQIYVRAPVKVDRVVDDRVLLITGPPVGMAVVTVGAAELLATEYEILNQHP